jgi:hypothetical protein
MTRAGARTRPTSSDRYRDLQVAKHPADDVAVHLRPIALVTWPAFTAGAALSPEIEGGVVTTMLTTITAPAMNIVQDGACIASNTAAMSHAHANARVARPRTT